MAIRENAVLRFEWDYPGLAEMEMRFLSASRYFASAEGVMEVAKRIAIEDMAEHFEREEDPQGREWHPWADSYEQRAMAENIGILRKTEALYESAIDPSNYHASPNELTFDTSGLEEYWVFHDQPVGQGYDRIPARPFVGLSEQAEEQIEQQFIEYVEFGGLILGGRTGTGVLRAPLGRFASARGLA